MIELRVRFWTNGIVDGQGEGEVIPKHAWDTGVVKVRPNEAHGIPSGLNLEIEDGDE